MSQVHRDHVAMAADGLGIDYTVHWDGILNRCLASRSHTLVITLLWLHPPLARVCPITRDHIK